MFKFALIKVSFNPSTLTGASGVSTTQGGDNAYDTKACYETIAGRQEQAIISVRKNARTP